MTIKLFATDLDGTFFNARSEISPLNESIVRRIAAKGIVPVFATGRPAHYIKHLHDQFPDNAVGLVSNGALVYRISDETVFHEKTINGDIALEVAHDITQELGERVGFATEYRHSWGLDRHYAEIENSLPSVFVDTLENLLAGDRVLKFMIRAKGIATDDLADIVEPIVGDRLTVTFSFQSDNGMLEMSAPNVTKASALSLVLNDLGIDAKDVAAFGDMPNDLAMLNMVGMPFAMDNCHPALAHLPSAGNNNDSGVGRTLARLLSMSI